MNAIRLAIMVPHAALAQIRCRFLGHARNRRRRTMAAAGCLVGVVGAQAGAGLLAKFMYETRASDPVTLVAVVGAVIAVAVVACVVPGWRASGEDPTRALRAE